MNTYEVMTMTQVQRDIEAAKAIGDIQGLKEAKDKLDAIREILRKQKAEFATQNAAAEASLRYKRGLGEILDEIIQHQGGRPTDKLSHDATVLEDIGITRSDSSRWQMISHLPEQIFEQHIATCNERKEELTFAGLLQVAKRYEKSQKQEQQDTENEEVIEDILAVDEIPSAQSPVYPLKDVQTGQVWRLGQHILYCGDSSSKEFQSLCKQSPATFAFADPPYNAEVEDWDVNFTWNHNYLSEVAPIVAVTPGISAIKDFMQVNTMPYKWSMSYWIDNGMTRGALGFGNWIYVALFADGSIHRGEQEQDLVRIEDKSMGRISITGGDHDDLKHKGRKPIELLIDLVDLFTEQQDTVIDPFLGTGTTLIVCEKKQRSCVGAEINPAYCQSIIKRWEKHTEDEAILCQ